MGQNMTTPFDAPDWRTMSQEERDLGLNNGVAVAGSADIAAGWERRSTEMRARYAGHLDLRYGPRERNRIDFLKVAENGPTLVFIHGGYWQHRAKEIFALFAAGPMAHGINVALIGYTLAPEATLDEIVAEIHRSLDFLGEQLPDQRRDPSRRRDHLVHDGEMVGAGDLFVSHRQSEPGAVARKIRGLLAQQRQFGAADDQRQRLHRATGLHDGRIAARHRFIEPKLDVEIAVADRLKIVDAADPDTRFYLRMR